MENTINTNLTAGGVLQIFCGRVLLAEISDGRDDDTFICDVLAGLGWIWHDDGTATREN